MSNTSITVTLVYIAFAFVTELFAKHREDVDLNVKELIVKYGYPFQEHTLITDDGYILEVHRIPHGRLDRNDTTRTKRLPVLLIPGALCSSREWISRGPTNSLGYLLADAGYDVWLANYRGTTWSRRHTTLNPDKDYQYWNFSIHEIGLYDVSAFIDYILQKTGHKSLYCIGHSQGAAATYVLNSERPEYNKKMRLMVLMAPAGFSSNSKSIFYLIARTYLKDIVDIFQKRNIYEFFSQSSIVGSALRVLCDPNFEFRVICYGLILAIAGYSPEQIDKRRLPALVHFPAGIGLKDVVHFIQLTTADEVLKYDYGEAENLVKYRQVTPPAYNLSAMVAPSAFYYGDRDALVDPLDVLRLADMFPNVVAKTLIKGFNHVDFYGDLIRLLHYINTL